MSAAPELLYNTSSPTERLRDAVEDGLRTRPRTLPAALLYDARGARLFEAICDLPEYYPTRTEHAILARHAGDIADLIGPQAVIIELGSGAATKVRHLLPKLVQPGGYVPVDVSREQLLAVAAERALEFPHVPVLPVWADFADELTLPLITDDARRVAFFPGSTIGNLEAGDAAAFLRRVREMVGDAGGLVLGVDRRKSPQLLHAAYNDAAGVTAEFNLNVLSHVNREFRGTFNRGAFRHRAFFNGAESRIEMHLEAVSPQHVHVAGLSIDFAAGESIRTEVSVKYDRSRLDVLAATGGFTVHTLFTDERDWFWVAWLVPV